MARLRYVKTPQQVKQDAEARPGVLSSIVRSLRVVYETDPALAAALVPRPLEPAARPEIQVTFSQVAMQLPGRTIEIGSTIFGARASYDGVPGLWLVTMPMTSEPAVLGGRDRYGEPKKLATIRFERDGGAVAASVSRYGIPYLEAHARLGASLGPRRFVEHAYTVKALPCCDPGSLATRFESDPLLVRLDWRHEQSEVRSAEGELTLRESPFDPVADLPVRRLVSMEYEEGTTESDGRVLRSLPAEWVLPHFHQRYDEPGAAGLEIG